MPPVAEGAGEVEESVIRTLALILLLGIRRK